MKQKELEARNMLLVCCLLQLVPLCDGHIMQYLLARVVPSPMTGIPTGESGPPEQAECQPHLQPQGDKERGMGGELQSCILFANTPTSPQLCPTRSGKLTLLPHLQGEATWQLQPMTDAKTDAKTLTLTIWDDEEQTFTIEQASQMPLPDFGRIWSVCHAKAHAWQPGVAMQACRSAYNVKAM